VELYAKLRQYPWEPGLDSTGNHGGHYGAYQPDFLRVAVLPLLLPDFNLPGEIPPPRDKPLPGQ
jgi:hypothetical protein